MFDKTQVKAWSRTALGAGVLWLAACGPHDAPSPPSASAAVVDRLASPIDDSQRALLADSANPHAQPAADVGRLESSLELSALSLSFAPSPAQQADLDQLLADQQDPRSPRFRQWLTPAAFGARFGLSDADLGAAVAWLQGQGFAVQRLSNSRTRVFFTGTVGQVERVFHTELHRYAVAGEAHFANATPLSVPGAFAGSLLYVGGLHDFTPRAGGRGGQHKTNYTSYFNGAYHYYFAPEDVSKIYDVASVAAASSLDGTGVSIAIIGASSCDPTQLATFRKLTSQPAATYQAYLVPSSGSSSYVDPNENLETYLDVEWAGAMAPAAALNFVFTGGGSGFGAFDALEYAADNPASVGNPSIISASYKQCESGATKAYSQSLRGVVQQATAQGITVLACAGDSGAAGCDEQGVQSAPKASGGIGVEIPSSFPEVVAVGGTELDEGSGSYWQTTNDSVSGSVKGYVPEMAWNDTALELGLESGGGGSSLWFTKPTWQTVTPADGARDVPDVAFSSSWEHDGYLLCLLDVSVSPADQYCKTGWFDSSGYFFSAGGTSAATPLFAGMIALLNESLGAGGLGNINSLLYQLAASTPGAFHDITTGNNIVPCVVSSPNCGCPSGTPGCSASNPDQYGYSAAAGYDLTTGLGSVDFGALWAAWPTQTTTTLTAARPADAIGQADLLTATVSTTRIGPAIGSDTVTFYDGMQSLAAVNVSPTSAGGIAGAVATYQLVPTAGGSHQITATFNGDPTYLTSTSAAVTVDVTSALQLSPPAQTIPTGGVVAFSAVGGSGGYLWSAVTPSGGAFAAGCAGQSSCAYTAGPTGGTQDVITVTDSDSDQSSVTLTVAAPVALNPASAMAVPGQSIAFAPVGGTAPFQWALATNDSGGSLSDAGVYVAGPTAPSQDSVQVTDALGSVATALVQVLPPVSTSATTSSNGTSGSTAASSGTTGATHGSTSGAGATAGSTGRASTASAATGAASSTGGQPSTSTSSTAGESGGGCGCGTAGGDSILGVWLACALFARKRRRS